MSEFHYQSNELSFLQTFLLKYRKNISHNILRNDYDAHEWKIKQKNYFPKNHCIIVCDRCDSRIVYWEMFRGFLFDDYVTYEDLEILNLRCDELVIRKII